MKVKSAKLLINQNLIRVLPLIEEITKKGLMPYCLIGFAPDKKEEGKINAHFATIMNEADPVLVELCKQLLEAYPKTKKKK
jgi:hypothetical protein